MDIEKFYNININPVGLAAVQTRIYTQQVRIVLDWIYQATTGKILFNSIRFHGQPVNITPFTAGGCNAQGGGAGIGNPGFVQYSPTTFILHGACDATRTAANHSALSRDSILFHELVHVFRNVSGKWSKRPVTGGLFFYDDTEEFLAVLITNIYISDSTNKIKPGLRGEHQQFSALESEFMKPFGFFSAGKEVAPLLKQFIKDNRGFSIRVANDVKAQFNPIADYLAEPGKCDELSRNARSYDRARIKARMPLFGKLLDLLPH